MPPLFGVQHFSNRLVINRSWEQEFRAEKVLAATRVLLAAAWFVAALAAPCLAQEVHPIPLTVLPWNGHKAAVSLTFDDALPSHLDVAMPELQKRGLHATFFVVIAKLQRLDEWKKLPSEAQEIGNHSVSHARPAGMAPEQEGTEVEDATHFLQGNLGVRARTFAYPYSEITPGLKDWVSRFCFAARTGFTGNYYLAPDSTPDWYAIPGQLAKTQTPLSEYQGWVDKDVAAGTWTVFQIHGIGEARVGYEPIAPQTFTALLDYLKAKQAEGLWVASFGEVAGYWRAQKIFEGGKLVTQAQGAVMRWDVPPQFPNGIVLKVKAPAYLRLYQGGRQLAADNGVYSVALDAKALTLVLGESDGK